MPRILLSASFPESQLIRQTPDGSGCWDEFEFITSPCDEAVDGWVVYDDLRHPMEQLCPAENTLLITGEPASVRRYRARFTGQFGQVWTAQNGIRHRCTTYRNEAQPWHYALRKGDSHGQPLGFDELAALECPAKTKLLSVICSAKTVTPDHCKRLEFVRLLQASLGDSIDVFGHGIRPLSDKSDAIWPYRYHIVLENDHSDYFMTEKISDAFLGWSYPIYFGGSEAYHRFPNGSFTAIDIYQTEQALASICECIESNVYETAIEQIAMARAAVLRKNNLFAMLADYWRARPYPHMASRTRLLPKSHRTELVAKQIQRAIARPLLRKVA